ncbi:type II secretion system protein GspD [Pelomicrobium methylotrophicum]|uniref:Type II/III secretion system secretin-like domain-containing protein n=1 Tax=Pelomicrobium methylotrophicum TaxID=2602750 RepID=A0A5C7EKM3_9PROT|nr:hypothetical protein [Pelomicrobium methylotrophicum]TXF11588.1 hypothetical protein FR698_09620 [Pelomicrobium methylotrophicum]
MAAFRISTLGASTLAAALTLGGCASVPGKEARGSLDDAVRAISAGPQTHVRVTNESYVAATPVEYAPPKKGSISIRAVDAPLSGIASAIAERGSYAIAFTQDVDMAARTSVDIVSASPEDALREAAFAAGYVAVVNEKERRATLARRATWTFKLPPRLLQNLTLNYSVSSNPSSQASASSAGATPAPTPFGAAPGADSSGQGGGAISAKFSVNATQRNPEGGFRQFLAGIAGGDVEVQAMPETGFLSVRGTGEQLRRVDRFVREFIRDAAAQVEIEASLVEVSLTEQMQAGIDWSRIIPLGGLGQGVQASVSITNAGVVSTPAVTATVTTASITSVVKALEKHAAVKVISRPRLLALNHSPAVVFDGEQIPYLGSVTSTVTGTSPTTQNSGSVSFAQDGVSLSFKPNILDAGRVEVTVVPVLSSVTSFETFDLGGGARLTAPRQPVRQAHLQVVAEAGKTVIIGGTRSARSSADRSGVPGAGVSPLTALLSGYDGLSSTKELVMLLRATIIPAPEYEPRVAESI